MVGSTFSIIIFHYFPIGTFNSFVYLSWTSCRCYFGSLLRTNIHPFVCNVLQIITNSIPSYPSQYILPSPFFLHEVLFYAFFLTLNDMLLFFNFYLTWCRKEMVVFGIFLDITIIISDYTYLCPPVFFLEIFGNADIFCLPACPKKRFSFWFIFVFNYLQI